MPTIKFPKNPNVDTAFVEQDDGTKNRALMIAPQDISTLELPNNPNSTKGYITVDGQKQRVILTADITGGGGGGSGLPDQTGHSGEFLTTDGTDASWSDKPLVNNSTSSNSLAIGNSAAASTSDSVVVGVSSYVQSGSGSTVIVGYNSRASTEATAIGKHAQANQTGCVAIGCNATAAAVRAIQIGYGSNTEAGTLSIGLYHNSQFQNYKLLDSDGTIPTARFTTDPVSDGTYVPTLTITSGVATRSWSAPSGGLPSQTGNSGKFLTTDGTDASWSDKPLVNKSTTGDGIVIAGSGESNRKNIVIGYNTSGTMETLALGHSTHASGYSLAIGNGAEASGNVSVAIGLSARATAGCIQISCNAFTPKINSNANTFKVANANGNFEIMDANGNLPADRLASTTGLADGNYRLRLTMASGVPTLSWVAE